MIIYRVLSALLSYPEIEYGLSGMSQIPIDTTHGQSFLLMVCAMSCALTRMW